MKVIETALRKNSKSTALTSLLKRLLFCDFCLYLHICVNLCTYSWLHEFACLCICRGQMRVSCVPDDHSPSTSLIFLWGWVPPWTWDFYFSTRIESGSPSDFPDSVHLGAVVLACAGHSACSLDAGIRSLLVVFGQWALWTDKPSLETLFYAHGSGKDTDVAWVSTTPRQMQMGLRPAYEFLSVP